MTRLRRTTRWRAHVSSAAEAQNKRPQRGRSSARGTGATAEGGRESEGCIRAWTSGNGGNARTRPSKGSPCRCDLQQGTMANALTLETMSPELVEVVATRSHEPHRRKSRMREIRLSGSGEGPGWATARPNLQGIFHFLPLPRERAPWPPVLPGGSALGQGAERRCTIWTCRSGWEGVGPSGVLWGNDLGKGAWEADAAPQRWETYFHYAHVASEITCDAVD